MTGQRLLVRSWLIVITAIISWQTAAGEQVRAAEDQVDFNRDIRPILSENCFQCHGPDKKAREADLRLDIEDEAKKDFGGYYAVKPGATAESEAYSRIVTDDPDMIMPPTESKRTLSAHQKELVRQWIDQGAVYARHWAFVAPRRPSPPSGVAQTEATEGWPRNAIDSFTLHRMQQQGLTPSAEADRRTLIRRVSLDLIGLPPTPEQVEAFVNDTSAKAYERVVDRLLASPRFGERWARPWLDLARYADSNGFQADQLRSSWPYRDWVIDSLNADLPFDQFTVEQLAGDLLPDASTQQKVATGFHRCVTCNVEAGVHPEENRVNQVIDRVNTTGTVWLGTTIECCQCHDHKYDPFSMEDYYGLFAYFNNTPVEVRNRSGKGVSFDFYGPTMEVPLRPDQQTERQQVQAQHDQLAKNRQAILRDTSQRNDWEKQLADSMRSDPEWHVLKIERVETDGGEDVQVLDDNSALFTGRLPDTTTYTVTVSTRLDGITAFKLETLTHDKLPGKGPGRGDAQRTNFILSELKISVRPASAKKSQPVELHNATADFSQTGWEVEKAIDGNRKTGWAIAPEFQKPHWAVFRTAEPVATTNGEELTFTLDQNYGRGRTIGRLRLSAHTGLDDAVVVPKDIANILDKPADKRRPAERRKLDQHYAQSHAELKKIDVQMRRLENQLGETKASTTLVMVEMEKPRETHVLIRGNYLNKGDRVVSATPAALHPRKAALPANRLGLAKWLVDPANPLVARVTVNRWWAELFGQGIVKTQEDFGAQGEPPTHPELLDWLAVEFVESGWSMKHMLRLMVTSATYRQASRVTPKLLKHDPENEWYARGPRFRMSAEMIRDSALAVSGLLSEKMHGPPIMPFQPAGIWRQVGRNEPKWVEATDEDRYRRGIYVVYRRAAPYPSFVNFDAPDRGACTVKRPRTNTPLQALTLLNDPTYVEMALALAARVLAETPDTNTAQRIDHAFQLVLARPATATERDHVTKALNRWLGRLSEDPQEARKLIAGASRVYQPPADLQPVELAAWFYVANILLNLDETIVKD